MMKSVLVASIAAFAAGVQAAVQGFDISHYQSSVDFAAAYKSGARFVIIKVRREEKKKQKSMGGERTRRLPFPQYCKNQKRVRS